MSSILLPVAAALIAQANVQGKLPAIATGAVVDAASGQPISGALVQQEGSVTSVFTHPDGSFRLLLDRAGRAQLTVSAVGFESVTVPVGNGQGLRVRLTAVSGFVPAEVGPHTEEAQAGSAETAPLNTGIQLAYRLRREAVEQGGASYTGLANNDFRIGLRYRMRPWLLEAEGAHFQTPVELPSLPRESNPAFSPSTWQAGARVNYMLPLSSDLESAVGLGYRWSNTVPNNNNIRYTGSGIDFEQTRQALGAVGTVAYRPGRGPWHFEGSLGLYPLVFGSAKDPGTPFASSFLTDARAIVGYEVVRGLRLGVGYQFDDWRGNGADSAHLFSLNAQYTPGGLPKGND